MTQLDGSLETLLNNAAEVLNMSLFFYYYLSLFRRIELKNQPIFCAQFQNSIGDPASFRAVVYSAMRGSTSSTQAKNIEFVRKDGYWRYKA